MSDRFEDEVRSALRSGASDELSSVGLAEGARDRLRRRRSVASGAGIVAAVVLAVPVGFAVLGGADSRDRPAPRPETTTATEASDGVPSDWHWEAWAGVEIAVPDTWRPGALDQWCVGGDPMAAVVQRPDTVQTLVLCEAHQRGYGLLFDAHGTPKEPGRVWEYTQGTEFPHGSWIANMGTSNGVIVIVAQDRDLAEEIVGSSRPVGDFDAAGCARTADVPDATARGLVAADNADNDADIALCEYSGTDGSLLRSKVLTAQRGRDLLTALSPSSPPQGTALPDCAAIDPNGVLVLQRERPIAWVIDTRCSDSRVLLAGDGSAMWSTAIADAARLVAPYPSVAPDVSNPDEPVSNGGSTGGGSTGSEGTVEPVAPDASPAG